MAGTINLALTQQFDMDGRPLSGGFLYFFTAGTTTPQTAFQDIALTIAHPNPLVLDASGRVPMFYVADGNIKIRLTTETGVTVIAADNLLVIGPSSGGGGGAGVDVSTVLQTGDVKARYGTAIPLDGFVRCNGLTIGNATSGGTERFGDVCQALFEYLWPFPNILLDGVSKGSSANTDFISGRRLFLPDLRGRTIAGLDDMGAAAAGRLTASFFGTATVAGNVGGAQSIGLVAANMVDHTHTQQGTFITGGERQNHNHGFSWSGTTAGNNENLDHTHPYTDQFFQGNNQSATGGNRLNGDNNTSNQNTGGASFGFGSHSHNYSGSSTTGLENQAHDHAVTISGQTGGMSGAGASGHANVQPTMVMTFYMKL